MSIVQRLREAAEVEWVQVVNHPFVQEAASGRLPRHKFCWYVLQDYNYLIDSVRSFCWLVAKADSVHVLKTLLSVAHNGATVELEGYETFIKSLGFTLEYARQLKPFPVNQRYREYLLAMCRDRPLAEALAAILPCYKTYSDIPRVHAAALAANPNELYRAWARAYEAPSYLDLLATLESLVEDQGAGYPYEKLQRAFLTSVSFELQYWHEVYAQAEVPLADNASGL